MRRDEDRAITFASRCLADGVYVTPIVFPAVPQDAPRIRTSITAALRDGCDHAGDSRPTLWNDFESHRV